MRGREKVGREAMRGFVLPLAGFALGAFHWLEPCLAAEKETSVGNMICAMKATGSIIGCRGAYGADAMKLLLMVGPLKREEPKAAICSAWSLPSLMKSTMPRLRCSPLDSVA